VGGETLLREASAFCSHPFTRADRATACSIGVDVIERVSAMTLGLACLARGLSVSVPGVLARSARVEVRGAYAEGDDAEVVHNETVGDRSVLVFVYPAVSETREPSSAGNLGLDHQGRVRSVRRAGPYPARAEVGSVLGDGSIAVDLVPESVDGGTRFPRHGLDVTTWNNTRRRRSIRSREQRLPTRVRRP
jgi:hypothetical protein